MPNISFSRSVFLFPMFNYTKKKNQEYFSYLELIKNNNIARKVKIADLKHNSDLKRLKSITQKDIDRAIKYKKAIDYLCT